MTRSRREGLVWPCVVVALLGLGSPRLTQAAAFEVVAIEAFPPRVQLDSALDRQRIVVQARAADGRTLDVTAAAEIGPPAANRSAAPRNTDMPPSVTTKAGTLSLVMAMPCSRPPSSPTAIAARAASPSAYVAHGVVGRAAARGGSTGVMNDGRSLRSETVTAAAWATTGGAGAAATTWSINGCCGGSDGDTGGRPRHAAIASAASAPD